MGDPCKGRPFDSCRSGSNLTGGITALPLPSPDACQLDWMPNDGAVLRRLRAIEPGGIWGGCPEGAGRASQEHLPAHLRRSGSSPTYIERAGGYVGWPHPSPPHFLGDRMIVLTEGTKMERGVGTAKYPLSNFVSSNRTIIRHEEIGDREAFRSEVEDPGNEVKRGAGRGHGVGRLAQP